MARYQYPNAGDLLFFAAEAAEQRMGLPGATAHFQLELANRLDIERLRHAVAALWRVYPATAARPELSLRTGRPRWRLDGARRDPRRIVRLHELAADAQSTLHGAVEELFNTGLNLQRRPPVQFHVFRRPRAGDVLIMRCTHALADGRGCLRMLEELDRLWREGPDLSTLRSAGDELRNDLDALIAEVPLRRRLELLRESMRSATPGRQPGIQLARDRIPRKLGRLYFAIRQLDARDLDTVRRHATQLGEGARLSDYLRASGIAALHAVLPKPVGWPWRYTMMNYIDNRRHRPGAVCWNFTSALPIAVPAWMAPDRRQVARHMRAQMTAHRTAQTAVRDAVTLRLVTRLPTACFGALIRSGFAIGSSPAARMGMRLPLSLPFGILGGFGRPMPTFCGATLENGYAYRTVIPQPGYAVDLTLLDDRLNVVGAGLESRVSRATLNALLDRFVQTVLQPL